MRMTKVVVPISLIRTSTTTITTWPPLTLLWLQPLPGGPRIWEWWDWSRNGPGGPEYEGYGLEYGKYELELFEHLGYEPRRGEFEGTTGRDVENVKNGSQRLVFEPDRETQGMPIPWLHPLPTPAAGHLNPSTTSICHCLPSPPLINWTFHLPDPLLDTSNTRWGL